MELLPLSVVVATRDRAPALEKMFSSLWAQEAVPAEIVIVDASEDFATQEFVVREGQRAPLGVTVKYQRSSANGSAMQRNEGVRAGFQPVVGFMDDDIVLEAGCLPRLWAALHSADDVGGANAMITNQKYHNPGITTRFVYRLMGGGSGPDYAGKIFGPAVNTLPADRDDMPEVVPVDWLNTTCTLYRREALPDPPFASFFTGYSMMEDAALSLVVARQWRLVNARTARIFHDSQPGTHKSNPAELARMAVVNRDFVARRILGRKGPRYWLPWFFWGLFQTAAMASGALSSARLRAVIKGSFHGYVDVMFARANHSA